MRTLVIGGSASGKSEFAENLAVSGTAPLYYIATMMPYDGESVERIKKHQAMRAQKSFTTIECYKRLDRVVLPVRGTVLLECLGTLTANELFAPEAEGSQGEGSQREESQREESQNEESDCAKSPDLNGISGQKQATESILTGFQNLEKQCDELIVVSNDVFADGIQYDDGTKLYMETLGAVNRELARYFERVIEVVCGIPVVHKGELA